MWLSVVFVKDTAVLFHWEDAPPLANTMHFPNCAQQLYHCVSTVTQWLMNNMTIIPINTVIKWDWVYLPVCSYWARSSIIIPRAGG